MKLTAKDRIVCPLNSGVKAQPPGNGIWWWGD